MSKALGYKMFPSRRQYIKWSLPSKITYISFWVGVIGLVLAISPFILQPEGKLKETIITEFVPKTPEEVRKGSCWVTSLSVERPNAWRCNVENRIYDPCFERISLQENRSKAKVICNATPSDEQNSFILDLTEPLPSRKSDTSILGEVTPESVWYLELENGSFCNLNTGATTSVFGNRLNYACSSKSKEEIIWLIGYPRTGKIWSAMKLVTDKNQQVISNSVVNIKNIYR